MFDEVKHCKSFIMLHLLPVSPQFRHATEELRYAIAFMGRGEEAFEHAAKIQSEFGAAGLIDLCIGPSTILTLF